MLFITWRPVAWPRVSPWGLQGDDGARKGIKLPLLREKNDQRKRDLGTPLQP